MAIKSNKELLIADEKIKAASYEVKSSRAHYLPSVDASAAYMYNSKNISLISDKQAAAIGGMIDNATGALGSLFPDLAGSITGTDAIPGKLKEALTFDMHNIYVGTVSVTQPLYMGGKIRAYYDITRYSEELARTLKSTAVKDLIITVDQNYWQIISLVHKKKMAESYVNLLERLSRDVGDMLEAGIATKSDELTVAVKLNEAQIALTKIDDGLVLSKMLLSQLCGLPISDNCSLIGESAPPTMVPAPLITDMEDIFKRRTEIKSLRLVADIYKKKEVISRSAMLPQVALMGNYTLMNPHVFNGFQNKFDGMFTVGVGVKIPVWHWGEHHYKLKAEKSQTRSAILKLEDAREKVELQVNKALFQVQESNRTLLMTITNMDKAEEIGRAHV